MITRIAGIGWVTPLGADLEFVWQRLMRGDVAEAKAITNPETKRELFGITVPPELTAHLGRNPRLRRSSAISLFAAAAGLAALENAGLAVNPETAARTAVVFAIASGGVVYTRKFYDAIVKQGANSASPLLFPETVYNAPASHLAALLGIDGASYTLVGDSSIGVAALGFADQLLATDDTIDQCLVVGAEEIDWVLCQAYRDWRLAAAGPRTELHAARPPGFVLAEGAAAVVLSRTQGKTELRAIHDGVSFFSHAEAAGALEKVCAELVAIGRADCVLGSANGGFMDALEAAALVRHLPGVPLWCLKGALGEALGASALMQVVAAVLALENGELPAVSARAPNLAPEPTCGRNFGAALVLAAGLNQQAGGAVLTRVAR